MLAREGYELAPEAERVFRAYLERRRQQPRFANARSVRNAIERARLRHAGRLLAAGGLLGRAELTTLRPEDFLASRVLAMEGQPMEGHGTPRAEQPSPAAGAD